MNFVASRTPLRNVTDISAAMFDVSFNKFDVFALKAIFVCLCIRYFCLSVVFYFRVDDVDLSFDVFPLEVGVHLST